MQFRRTLNHRTIALLHATAFTFGPLIALNLRNPPRIQENAFERVSYLRLLQSSSTPSELTKPPSAGEAKRNVGSSVAPAAIASTYTPISPSLHTSTSEITQSISSPKAENPETPELPASAPLKLDVATIRAAHRAAKSDARNLAERSGTYFGDETSSKAERLADAVSRTGKEDCIGPNPGGSLLSVLDIAFKAAREKCK